LERKSCRAKKQILIPNLELGDKDLAAKAIKQSLEIKPDQERIRELIKGIK